MSKKEKQTQETHVPEKKEAILPDPSIEKMTKTEALAYFDLPEWASREELDKQFWKLGKTYKAQKDEQKLADIACAYNIANGERDRKEAEKKKEESEKHYFGKTKKQWQDFWSYEWIKFVIGIAVVIAIVAVLRVFILAPKLDFRLSSIGYFEQNLDILYDYLKSEDLCREPDVAMANFVAENNENAEVDQTGAQKAIALMAVYPDIVVYDAPSAPTYVYGENMEPLDELYEEMKATWTPDQLSHIEPYVYSRARFYEEYAATLPEIYKEDLEELTEEDYVEHVYGFKVKDELDQKAMGYTIKWEKGDKSLIFSVNAAGDDIERAKNVLCTMLSDIDKFRSAYREKYPYIESED